MMMQTGEQNWETVSSSQEGSGQSYGSISKPIIFSF